jgi:hypothetical protein
MLDNSTTVHYVKKSGGSKSEELSWISFEIVVWWEPLAMSINAVYLHGAKNTVSDELSSASPDSSD